jgi:hypothetical protein
MKRQTAHSEVSEATTREVPQPSDLPFWAQDKAREWLERRDNWGYPVACPHDSPPVGPQSECPVCLAALLVEVAAVGQMVNAENAEYLSTLRTTVLAEVRRVVEEVRGSRIEGHCFKCVRRAGDEILARIEKL